MNRRQCIGFSSLLLLAVLVGVPAWLTWRIARHESLNRALFDAVTADDNHAVISLLAQGADPNTRAVPQLKRTLRQMFFDTLHGRQDISAYYMSPLIYAAARGDTAIVK